MSFKWVLSTSTTSLLSAALTLSLFLFLSPLPKKLLKASTTPSDIEPSIRQELVAGLL